MREMRSISFSEQEAIRAVIELMQRQRQPLPKGRVLRLELREDPVGASLVVEDDYGAVSHVQRNAAELTASLVSYCIDRRIRLPNRGRKFVEVIGGAVNLLLYLDEVPAGRSLTRPRAPGRH